MEQFSIEINEIINRLKKHKQKKELLVKQDNVDKDTLHDATGRISALTHAISELEHLYMTGTVRPEESN